MVPPKTDQAMINRLRESLLRFNDTSKGKDFFKKSQFESFLPPDQAAMERIDPYIHVLIE